ncbi:MAG: hypothetical protein CL581_11555 [Alteromonadaceae bacterium]|uniref:hypothetical protein n=1 Tax=Marinobacter sp. BGYM27 TaxID=2975597 RepID=UPI000C3D92EB|nr:hypothetical protein [Marinobacter sp. BGYM27]MAA65401.1 hypothetical protein [Alteromonadaceae bacterium]MBH85067.1 hypothetical protein [Alteromonadaceae bacterium]MDG5500140.1 hypothetical protein [Marinobacter sp. BGYM27]|tara:strand:+ start:211 stop:456 length:246 start_codon:yes stop_codon:yes gene_type:complete
MSHDTHSKTQTARLKYHAVVETVLILALAVYFFLAESHIVGDDIVFTAIGAALMVVATFWTLTTTSDLIGVVAERRNIRNR